MTETNAPQSAYFEQQAKDLLRYVEQREGIDVKTERARFIEALHDEAVYGRAFPHSAPGVAPLWRERQAVVAIALAILEDRASFVLREANRAAAQSPAGFVVPPGGLVRPRRKQ
jgi:hypothetical protein